MRFTPTALSGAWLIDPEPVGDDRGHLMRTFCAEEFDAVGLHTTWVQMNRTHTKHRGTVRGMHYQAEPRPEIKLVRCVTGAIHDVIVDLREDEPTFGQWQAFELTAANARSLYVPAGFAHGFQCLTDDCDVHYSMSEPYVPDLARGIRWDDPDVGIAWPLPVDHLSDRDRHLPGLADR